jgi:hypothetical protein
MITKTLLASLLTIIGSQVYAASSIYYPKPGGIICDKKAGFCADDQGVSVSITEMELGPKASKGLMAQINEVGVANFDATSFTMSGGLQCETKQKKCFNRLDKKVDAKATKALFGQ